MSIELAGGVTQKSTLCALAVRAKVINGKVPLMRWDSGDHSAAGYGSFLIAHCLDHQTFRISPYSAQSMDPQNLLLLQGS